MALYNYIHFSAFESIGENSGENSEAREPLRKWRELESVEKDRWT